MIAKETDVIIVGAGPTGLMAANQLNRFGADFIIVDSKKGPTMESRAIAVTSRSLEIYEQMGLSEVVIALGQRINSFQFYSGGKPRGTVVLGEMGKGLSDFNYLLGFEQSNNEELLYRNLQDHGRDVAWETTFIALQEYETSIHATFQYGQEEIAITAKYLIACDGAKSPVRHQLNMKFEGGTYENKFFVADTVLKWDLGYDALIISPSKTNFVGFFPMKGNSNYRVLGTLPDHFHTTEDIAFGDIQEVVQETVGVPVHFEKVNWFSTYNLHHRRVDHFDKGKVFFAGDAAHIHSPAGGQGMNTGLQDAYNLAWKLSFVLKGYAHPEILKTYTEERLPFAKWLMSFTDRGFRVMTSDNPVIAFLRTHVASNLIGMFVKFSWLRLFAFKTVSQIGYSYAGQKLSSSYTKQKLKFRAGDRLPYVQVDGTSKSIYHMFTENGFHLLHIGDTVLDPVAIARLKQYSVAPLFIIENKITPAWKEQGVENEIFLLVRPDNYIMTICDDIKDVWKGNSATFFQKKL